MAQQHPQYVAAAAPALLLGWTQSWATVGLLAAAVVGTGCCPGPEPAESYSRCRRSGTFNSTYVGSASHPQQQNLFTTVGGHILKTPPATILLSRQDILRDTTS